MIKRLTLYLLFLLSFSVAATFGQDSLVVKNFTSKDYKASPYNYSGIVDHNGVLYFANESGVLKYDGSDWQLIQITNFGSVHSLFYTNDQRIYVAGNNEFGYIVNDALNNQKYVSLRATVTDSIEFKEFWQIEEAYGHIYFISYEGIVKFDGVKSEVLALKNGTSLKIEGDLMVSRFDGGLYHVKDNAFSLVNSELSWDNDCAFGILPAIGSEQKILYTSQNGMYNYNKRTNEFTTFTTDLADSANIYHGQVWRDSLYVFSTWSSGIVVLNKDGHLIRHIGKSDGLESDHLKEIVIDFLGNIWVTSLNGINYLKWNTNHFKKDYTSKTMITNVVYGKDNDDNSRSVTFFFATPGYDKSDLMYKYYLSGYQKNENHWSTEVKREYTDLEGGNYQFMVKAKLPDGSETPFVTSNIYIRTLWYNNNFYRGLIATGIIVLAILFFGYRTRRLLSRNRTLEQIVQKRTHELLLQQEQLKKTNEELTISNRELDNFVYRSSHDLVAPLKSLKGLINIAKLESEDTEQLKFLNMMENRVFKLEDFIKSIMEYSMNTKHNIKMSSVSLDNIINSIVEDLKYYNNVDKIRLIKNYDHDLVISTDAHRLKIVLSNLITNCIKYHDYNQAEPTITIDSSIDCATETTTIKVIDNGLGIDSNHLSKIFNMFYRASNGNSEGSGLGLYIVKDTVSKIGGEIAVDSTLGKGTIFTITLPNTNKTASTTLLNKN